MTDEIVQKNIPLAPLTTFNVGGPAEHFIEVQDEEMLVEAFAFAKREGLAITVLGGGSNVLIADDGIQGLVIKNSIGGITYTEKDSEVEVTAGAGVVWDELVEDVVVRGLWGIENLSAIPGTVGATPVQNVGAYGVEVAELITGVRVYDAHEKTFTTLSPRECAFGYRDSIFKHTQGIRYVVTKVHYTLSKSPVPKLEYKDLQSTFGEGDAPTLMEIRDAVIAIRKKKFPPLAEVGTAGSFFKNPLLSQEDFDALKEKYPALPGFPAERGTVKVPLGWILEHVLCVRGVREGAVGTYKGQALVLVNHGGATSTEVDAFANMIEKKVFDATGIVVEREVQMKS